MSSIKYLKDYAEGESVSEIYLCKQKQVMTTKAGKPYWSVTLQDKTGIMNGKVWDFTDSIDEFDAMMYVYIDGLITSFKGELQINISGARIVDENEYDPAEYIPCSKKNIDEMMTELYGFINSVTNPYFNCLLRHYFVDDQEFVRSFKAHSAAKNVHHAFMGGLLEHTLAVVKICGLLAVQYPRINRDLLITAAILHDIGKVYELTEFPLNDYSEDGNLTGHIYRGAHMIENDCNCINGFPAEMRTELVHCILSHHGKLEYGSPKQPGIIEAIALNMADNTDAKLEIMTEALDGAGDKMEWLGPNYFLDGSNIRQTYTK